MAANYRQLFSDAQRKQAIADALSQQAMTPVQRPQGRIVANTGFADGIAQLGTALAARRAGKQAGTMTTEAEEARRKAQAAALSGMQNPPNLVERPEVQSQYGRANAALEADVHPAIVQQYMQDQRPDPGKLVSAIGQDGRPQYVREADAVGMQPYSGATDAKPPASIAEYELAKSQGYEGTFRDWQQEMARGQVIEFGGAKYAFNPVTKEYSPLSTSTQETGAAVERAEALATAEQERESAKAQQEKLATYRLYEEARRGLIEGLEGTETGPIAGRIPAVTAAQQTAEGGVAAMAPVLKQLFRVAGEGIFTDRDQALLLDMVPKRTDEPEARAAKMANIDAIVRAKLGMSGSTQTTELQVGAVEDGYEYLGGDPSKPESWRKL